VVELPFREGERVKEGDLVARLEDKALESAEVAAGAALRAHDRERARVEELLARGAATPKELEEAEARAAAARAALAGARESLAYVALRAPFAGAIASRPVHVGDVVAPGSPVIEIDGDGGLEIRATVEAGLSTAVRPGRVVLAQVDSLAGPLSATIRSVSPSGDPSTHRFELIADLPPSAELRAGLFARVLLPFSGPEERLRVPSSALLERGGLTGVFVLSDGRVRLRWVAIGAASAGMTEIRAGLEPGERVAVDPEGLTDGVLAVESP
jgi:RND family efflux transporter MFP subunit